MVHTSRNPVLFIILHARSDSCGDPVAPDLTAVTEVVSVSWSLQVTWRLNGLMERTCEHSTAMCSRPLPRSYRAFRSIQLIFRQHTEIILQDVADWDYVLRLVVQKAERELQTKDDQTWTPSQRLYIHCFSTLCTHWMLCVCGKYFPDIRGARRSK